MLSLLKYLVIIFIFISAMFYAQLITKKKYMMKLSRCCYYSLKIDNFIKQNINTRVSNAVRKMSEYTYFS